MCHPDTHSVDPKARNGGFPTLDREPTGPIRLLHSATLPNPIFCEAFPSALENWPIKLGIATLETPYLARKTLLIAADCAPFAMARFHERMMQDRSLLACCPKLEDGPGCLRRLVGILRSNDIKAVEVAYMNTQCCSELVKMVEEALLASGKQIPIARKEITSQGRTS